MARAALLGSSGLRWEFYIDSIANETSNNIFFLPTHPDSIGLTWAILDMHELYWAHELAQLYWAHLDSVGNFILTQ